MKKSFTLVEILIVVAVLGILAAIVLPTFQDHITEAKEAAAKDNLRMFRQEIELGVGQGIDMQLLTDTPENPFNNLKTVNPIITGQPLPSEATGSFGWIYHIPTQTIRLDWPGTDTKGIRYYDY